MITKEIVLSCSDIPNISIGMKGTFNTRRIVFDYSLLRKRFGEGEFSLLFLKPGEPDTLPEEDITVPVTISGNKAIWTITETDTATAGSGLAECIYKGNKFCFKSNVFLVIVKRDIDD